MSQKQIVTGSWVERKTSWKQVSSQSITWLFQIWLYGNKSDTLPHQSRLSLSLWKNWTIHLVRNWKQIRFTFISRSMLFCDFVLDLWSRTIRTLWSWTIHNLKEFFLRWYAPGSYLKCTLLQEYVCYVVLEQYAFHIWSWRISMLCTWLVFSSYNLFNYFFVSYNTG